eukprot:6480809-Amphidinium_carterae.1
MVLTELAFLKWRDNTHGQSKLLSVQMLRSLLLLAALVNKQHKHTASLARRDKKAWIAARCNELEHADGSSQWFRSVKRQMIGHGKDKHKVGFGPLKKAEKTATSVEEKHLFWQEHWSEVFMAEPCVGSSSEPSFLEEAFPQAELIEDVTINPEDWFTLDEVQMAVSKQLNHKACAERLPTEALQAVKPIIVPLLARMLNAYLNTGQVPLSMRGASLFIVAKKNFPQLVSDYRGISLAPFPVKVLSRLLMQRLKPSTRISLGQFRINTRHASVGTDIPLAMITQLLTRVASRKVCQAYVFIDVKRAFDNVITPVLTEVAEALTERNLQDS